MALVSRRREDELRMRHRDDWEDERWWDDWHDWPRDWPTPRELAKRFWSDLDRGRDDWPRDWPAADAMMPRFSSHLDRMDRNWRSDPFWKDLYPRWAEPIFKDGLDVKANIINDRDRFAVEIDAYQFRPEEIQVKTQDDTVLIEGRHEDMKDKDNYTKMYFVRKYQLPTDVDPMAVSSSINNQGRLTVEAPRRPGAIQDRDRVLPIEGTSGRGGSRTSRRSESPRHRYESGTTGYKNGYNGDRVDSRQEYRNDDARRDQSSRIYESQMSPASRDDLQERDYGSNTRNQSSSSYYHRSERRHYSSSGDRNGRHRSSSREFDPPLPLKDRVDSRQDYRNGDSRRDYFNDRPAETRNVEVRHNGASNDNRGFRNGEMEERRSGGKDYGVIGSKKDGLGERTESRSSQRSVQILRKTEELR